MADHPDWFPSNPYPQKVFTCTEDELCELVPDPDIRTRIAGYLMREAWELATGAFFEKYEQNFWECQECGGCASHDIWDVVYYFGWKAFCPKCRAVYRIELGQLRLIPQEGAPTE